MLPATCGDDFDIASQYCLHFGQPRLNPVLSSHTPYASEPTRGLVLLVLGHQGNDFVLSSSLLEKEGLFSEMALAFSSLLGFVSSLSVAAGMTLLT